MHHHKRVNGDIRKYLISCLFNFHEWIANEWANWNIHCNWITMCNFCCCLFAVSVSFTCLVNSLTIFTGWDTNIYIFTLIRFVVVILWMLAHLFSVLSSLPQFLFFFLSARNRREKMRPTEKKQHCWKKFHKFFRLYILPCKCDTFPRLFIVEI